MLYTARAASKVLASRFRSRADGPCKAPVSMIYGHAADTPAAGNGTREALAVVLVPNMIECGGNIAALPSFSKEWLHICRTEATREILATICIACTNMSRCSWTCLFLYPTTGTAASHGTLLPGQQSCCAHHLAAQPLLLHKTPELLQLFLMDCAELEAVLSHILHSCTEFSLWLAQPGRTTVSAGSRLARILISISLSITVTATGMTAASWHSHG